MSDNNSSADSFYQLHYSTDGKVFKKVPKLQNADPPPKKKTVDDITPTDSHVKIEEPVNFYEGSEIKFSYAHIEGNADHTALKKAYDDNTELTWQFRFVDAPSLNQQFKGRITDMTPSLDKAKKMRMECTLSMTDKPVAITADGTPVEA
ncbi:hypothetical protein AAX05_03355 [Moraxella bovoculi]|uniref:hypothetical protein n=1 Tax=Moraxella bovoculi TaxID=386891 RepID=UPI000624BC5E|nr:hypothetical protein [Moraxella bovoculi]AKG09370.1 hypothetical protein AAX05_03355 [Moraxella bovoculi]AKG13196.1 hypothetical protein AAX11_03105 [Moraxella bovoculi]